MGLFNFIRRLFLSKFDRHVEDSSTRLTERGDYVQSLAEVIIADFLYEFGVEYEYDKKMFFNTKRPILGKYRHRVRPDFYLPEYQIYIEYWGMGDEDGEYSLRKDTKLEIYEDAGVNLISIGVQEPNHLRGILRRELEWRGVSLRRGDRINGTQCKTCGVVTEGFEFCYQCKQLELAKPPKKTCENCGKRINEEYTLCYDCNVRRLR